MILRPQTLKPGAQGHRLKEGIKKLYDDERHFHAENRMNIPLPQLNMSQAYARTSGYRNVCEDKLFYMLWLLSNSYDFLSCNLSHTYTA